MSQFPSDPFAPDLLARLPRPPRKVAVVRACRIGDFVCATPALRALRAALPEAEITMVALPLVSDIVARLPFVDRFAPFPGYPGIAEQFFDARRVTAFFQTMQAERFDLAIQMQGSGVNSNPFTLMLGACGTAGYVRPGDGPGRLDAALPLPETGHEVGRVLALAEFLGAPSQGLATVFPLWAEDRAAAARLLAAPPPFIGLHPGARDVTRQWALDRFATAGRTLRARHGGTLVLLGGPDERAAAETVARLAGLPCLNLAGQLTLPVLGAILERLAVFLTNDSGPAHIAYALRCPTVTIFGSADPARYGPPCSGPFRALVEPVACRPCDHSVCPIGAPCLTRVTVDRVVAAGQALARQT